MAEIKTLFGLISIPSTPRSASATSRARRHLRNSNSPPGTVTLWFFRIRRLPGAGQALAIAKRKRSCILPYHVTVTNAATFVQDGGVRYASGSNAWRAIHRDHQRDANNRRDLAAGVNTFAAADTVLFRRTTYSTRRPGAIRPRPCRLVQSQPAAPIPSPSRILAHLFRNGGVVYAATGLANEGCKVPTVGQYSVSAGVYTFAAADASVEVEITYVYSGGQVIYTFMITNTAMGSGPIVGLQLLLPYEAPSFANLNREIFLPNVRSENLQPRNQARRLYGREHNFRGACQLVYQSIAAQSHPPVK